MIVWRFTPFDILNETDHGKYIRMFLRGELQC